VVNATPWPLYPQGKRPGTGYAPAPGRADAENLAPPAGIDPHTVQTCPYKQSIKDTGAKFHENLFGGSRAVTSRQTNGQTWES